MAPAAPISKTLFKDVHYYLCRSSLSQEHLFYLKICLEAYGGTEIEVLPTVSNPSKLTHIICFSAAYAKYSNLRQTKYYAIVTPYWIYRCLLFHQILNEEHFSSNPIKIFSSLLISLAYPEKKKSSERVLSTLIHHYGGQVVVGNFAVGCTHFVAPSAHGHDYAVAVSERNQPEKGANDLQLAYNSYQDENMTQWTEQCRKSSEIPEWLIHSLTRQCKIYHHSLVCPEWINECIRQGKVLDETHFPIPLLEANKDTDSEYQPTHDVSDSWDTESQIGWENMQQSIKLYFEHCQSAREAYGVGSAFQLTKQIALSRQVPCFSDFIFFFSNQNRPSNVLRLQSYVEALGGTVTDVMDEASHLVLLFASGDIHERATREKKSIVNPYWVKLCYERRKVVEITSMFSPLFRPLKFPGYILGMEKMVITTTGFTANTIPSRDAVRQAIQATGACCLATLSRTHTTHLIFRVPQGDKYDKAVEWESCKCITFDWLLECLKHWKLCHEDAFSTTKQLEGNGGLVVPTSEKFIEKPKTPVKAEFAPAFDIDDALEAFDKTTQSPRVSKPPTQQSISHSIVLNSPGAPLGPPETPNTLRRAMEKQLPVPSPILPVISQEEVDAAATEKNANTGEYSTTPVPVAPKDMVLARPQVFSPDRMINHDCDRNKDILHNTDSEPTQPGDSATQDEADMSQKKRSVGEEVDKEPMAPSTSNNDNALEKTEIEVVDSTFEASSIAAEANLREAVHVVKDPKIHVQITKSAEENVPYGVSMPLDDGGTPEKAHGIENDAQQNPNSNKDIAHVQLSSNEDKAPLPTTRKSTPVEEKENSDNKVSETPLPQGTNKADIVKGKKSDVDRNESEKKLQPRAMRKRKSRTQDIAIIPAVERRTRRKCADKKENVQTQDKNPQACVGSRKRTRREAVGAGALSKDVKAEPTDRGIVAKNNASKKMPTAVPNVKSEAGQRLFLLTGTHEEQALWRHQIDALGGAIVSSGRQFDASCTHVVFSELKRTEKFVGACATGKWILKAQYLEDSYSRGAFLEEQAYEWGCSSSNTKVSSTRRKKLSPKNMKDIDPRIWPEAPSYWRRRRESSTDGPFKHWKVLLQDDLCPPRDMLMRIITVSGGEVLSELNPNNSQNIEDVLVALVNDDANPSEDTWLQGIVKAKIPCISARFVFDYITKDQSTPPQLDDYRLELSPDIAAQDASETTKKTRTRRKRKL